VTQIFCNVKPDHGGDRKTLEGDDFNLTTRNPWFSSLLVSSRHISRKSLYEPQALIYRSTERCIRTPQVLLKYCYIKMESLQWENWKHLLCRNVSPLTGLHYHFIWHMMLQIRIILRKVYRYHSGNQNP
jgi:hypothetical protein